MPSPFYFPIHSFALALLLAMGGCQTMLDPTLSAAELAALTEINTAVNHQGRSCPTDTCLENWPDVADLERLDYWDCKAYAVAKADRLIHLGYHPDRLEYVLVAGPPLRVAHAALLVDDRWVLDTGLRCQVCTLEAFIGGGTLQGRLPVADLPYARRALRRRSAS